MHDYTFRMEVSLESKKQFIMEFLFSESRLETISAGIVLIIVINYKSLNLMITPLYASYINWLSNKIINSILEIWPRLVTKDTESSLAGRN
jgi:hypothetical protein